MTAKIYLQPVPKTAAMRAMGANLAADQKAREMADLLLVVRSSANLITLHAEQLGDMEERLTALEALAADPGAL